MSASLPAAATFTSKWKTSGRGGSRLRLGAALSLAAHGGLLLVLLQGAAEPQVETLVSLPVSIVPGVLAPASSSASPSQDPTATAAAAPPPTPPPELAASPILSPLALPPVQPTPEAAEPPIDEARLESDLRQDLVAMSVTSASTAAGGACLLTAWLQAALQADPAVSAALPTIPIASRSTANAIMLWDHRWVAQPAQALQGVGAIRTALMVGVRSASPACQLQPVRGPELFTLTDGEGTVVLAVGSGEWRWADLLDDSDTGSAPAPR